MGLLKKVVQPTPDGDMSVIDHLDELRTRIIISIVAWACAAGLVWYLTPDMLRWMVYPLHGTKLYAPGLQDAFMIYLKLALIGGGFLAGPVVLWQLILFVVPALTSRERRAVLSIVPFGIILFVTGVAFSYFLVLPTAIRFLLSFTGAGTIEPMLMVDKYLSFVSTLALMCGVIFQMPLIILALGFIGLVNAKLLSDYRRFAWFGCFLLSAVMTPTPDAFTMCIVAFPMVLLYEVSIILVKIFNRPSREQNPPSEEI
jgi:sec-independent protein translocase protein TatC